jgi:hypothetical protein
MIMELAQALKTIHHGELLIGVMHELGFAAAVPSAKGTLYSNARRAIHDIGVDQCHRYDGHNCDPMENLSFFMGVRQYLCDVIGDKPGHISEFETIMGAMIHLAGGTKIESGDSIHRVLGGLIAQLVLERQKLIEGVIINRLSDQVLIDQSDIAARILGEPPTDGRFCWLVYQGLASKLQSMRNQIVITHGDTHWWQQPEKLTSTTNLSANAALQHVADSMITNRWE